MYWKDYLKWSDKMETMKKIWKNQKKFNAQVFSAPKTLEEKQRLTKEFILHLISECDEVLREINWKFHRKKDVQVNKDNLLEELIDCQKYLISIAQFWGFSEKDFVNKYFDKSEVVEQRFIQEKKINLLKDKKVICIDIDGVLSDYPGSFIRYVEAQTGMNLSQIKITEYNLYGIVGKVVGVKRLKSIKHKFRISGQKRTMDVFPGAVEGMKKLSKMGYTLVLLSARPYKKYPRIFSDTICWLKKNKIKYDAILWDENKEEKMLKEIPNAKYMIEDCMENAIKIANAKKKVFLMDNSYNQGYQHKNIIRVKNWKEIIQRLEEIK